MPHYFLAYDPAERDWSLWQDTGDAELLHVDWLGDVYNPPKVHRQGGWSSQFKIIPISDADADACVMFALHAGNKYAQPWNDFAKRVASSPAE